MGNGLIFPYHRVVRLTLRGDAAAEATVGWWNIRCKVVGVSSEANPTGAAERRCRRGPRAPQRVVEQTAKKSLVKECLL